MNAPTTTAPTELQTLQASLDEIMAAIIEYDLGPRQRRHGRIGRPYTMTEALAEFDEYLRMGPAQKFTSKLVGEPVRGALVYAVRQIGERLYEVGGTNAMHAACDAQEDFPHGMRRVSIIDKRWDGIGDWLS